MLIKYKPKVEHVKCVPLIPDPKDPKSYNRNTIQLLPGTNEITDDEWAAIKPHLAAEIKAGEIAVLSVKAKPGKRTPDGKARSIKDVPVSVARDIIEKCVNPATLKKWFTDESRDEVLLLVTKRMRKLKIDPDEIEKDSEKSSPDEEVSNEDTEDDEDGGEDDTPDKPSESEGTEDEDDEEGEDDEIPNFDKDN